MALGKLPPTSFLESVFEHLQKELIEFGIQIIIDKAMYMVNNFFDHESLLGMRTRVFYTLLAKLETTQSPSMQNLLATNMLSVASVDKLDLLISWLSAGAICSESASTLQKVLPLSKALRYQILKVLFRSPRFTLEEKERHLKLEMAEDFSNYDLNLKAACEAANCDMQAKEKIWAQYVKGEGFKNILEYKWSVANFYNIEDESQCRHFGEAFFRDLETVFST